MARNFVVIGFPFRGWPVGRKTRRSVSRSAACGAGATRDLVAHHIEGDLGVDVGEELGFEDDRESGLLAQQERIDMGRSFET